MLAESLLNFLEGAESCCSILEIPPLAPDSVASGSLEALRLAFEEVGTLGVQQEITADLAIRDQTAPSLDVWAKITNLDHGEEDTFSLTDLFGDPVYLIVAPDDGGDASDFIAVYAEPIWAPQGFFADDLCAIELFLNDVTGELAIIYYFEQPPVLASALQFDDASAYLAQHISDVPTDVLAPEQGTTDAPKCTVTRTQTIQNTHNSGSTTISITAGVAGGTRTSPSTSTTTTTTLTTTMEERMVNGRCVIDLRSPQR